MIKSLFDKIKSMQMAKNTIWFIVMLGIGIGLFYVIMFVVTPFASMTRFPSAVLLMYLGILALMYMDKIHHADINTTQAIKSNNISYALIMVAYAMIISAVILIA